MYCHKCGTKISVDWKVCPQCASPLGKTFAPSKKPDMVKHSPIMSGPITIDAPSPWLYGIGAGIIIIALVLATVLFFSGIFNLTPDTRFVVPSSQELNFDDAGKYNIFYEFQSSINGKAYSTGESLKGMEIDIQSEDGSQLVPLSTILWNTSYQIGTRAGRLLYEFDIKEPGIYILTTNYRDGTTTPEVVFAIGPHLDIFGITIRSIVIGYGGLILGCFVILLVFHKRRKAADQIMPPPTDPNISPRSRLAVTLLAFFVGWLGIHRFYLEKYVTGILMFITFGGFGIWEFIDFIMAVTGTMKDKDGIPITKW